MSEPNDAQKQSEKPMAASASPRGDTNSAQHERPADPESADDTLNRRMPGHEVADAALLTESRQHTRRSFAVAAAGAAAGFGLWRWTESMNHADGMQPPALRKAFLTNEEISKTLFREHALSPTYPLSRAENLRINGLYGLKMDLDLLSWRLQMVGVKDDTRHPRFSEDVTAWQYKYHKAAAGEDNGHDTKVDPSKEKSDSGGKPGESSDTATKMAPAEMQDKAHADQDKSATQEDENHTGRKPRGLEEAGESDSTLPPNTAGLLLTLDDVTRFPLHELVTQFKCIEGWSQIVHWAGVRMADFLDAYPPALIDGKEPKYVYMETPDGDYYVGYDLHVCRHPQTLLVTEMMGQPLAQKHGAPLRLHMPTKYGYKQIKRIGLIAYTNDKPDDYWTKLGYDWYAGL